MKFFKEIQSKHFGQGRDSSMEGNNVSYYEVNDTTKKKTVFHSFLSDGKIQNAARTNLHMKKIIKHLKEEGVLKYELYETTDGCAKQYQCGSALWFLSALSAEENVIIDQSLCAPGRGTYLYIYLIIHLSLFFKAN